MRCDAGAPRDDEGCSRQVDGIQVLPRPRCACKCRPDAVGVRTFTQPMDGQSSARASTWTGRIEVAALASVGIKAAKLVVVNWRKPRERAAGGKWSADDSSRGMRLQSSIFVGGRMIAGGAIHIGPDGRIREVGCLARTAASVVRCDSWVVSPGLIDLLEHLDYSIGATAAPAAAPLALRFKWPRDRSRWPRAAVRRERTKPLLMLAEARHLVRGTTPVAGRDAASGQPRNPDTWRGTYLASLTFPFGETADFGSAWPRARALPSDRGAVAHAGEGTDAGGIAELRGMLEQRSSSPARPALAVLHALPTEHATTRQMAAPYVSVVWSPCSNLMLCWLTTPHAMLRASNVRVALGSNWSVSERASVLDESRCTAEAVSSSGDTTPAQPFAMTTSESAMDAGARERQRYGRLDVRRERAGYRTQLASCAPSPTHHSPQERPAQPRAGSNRVSR